MTAVSTAVRRTNLQKTGHLDLTWQLLTELPKLLSKKVELDGPSHVKLKALKILKVNRNNLEDDPQSLHRGTICYRSITAADSNASKKKTLL